MQFFYRGMITNLHLSDKWRLSLNRKAKLRFPSDISQVYSLTDMGDFHHFTII